MKPHTVMLTLMVALPLALAAMHVATQTPPIDTRPPTRGQAVTSSPLVNIFVDADGTERSRVESTYITYDYANGTPRRLVITQLADPLFRNGFDTETASPTTHQGKHP